MVATTDTIHCTLKAYRRCKGLSQDELAQRVGVRRQAIYDMEAGRYLPNTAVALRLARVLGCSVEALFQETDPAHPLEPCAVDWLHGPEQVGARLALAQVRDKLVGVALDGGAAGRSVLRLAAADGMLRADRTVACELSPAQLGNTLLLLGCDPALSLLGDWVSRRVPALRSHTVFASSREALRALGQGSAHVAGIHYHGVGNAGGNLHAVQTALPDLPCLMVGLAEQEEGLMVARGNPLGLCTAADLGGGRIRLVNREPGAALRALFDSELARHNLPATAVSGYADVVPSHSEGALRVAACKADAALGLRVVAEAFDLDFVPLAVTRCDLVIPADLADHAGHAGLAALLDSLQSAALRNELRALPGYDASVTGNTRQGVPISQKSRTGSE